MIMVTKQVTYIYLIDLLFDHCNSILNTIVKQIQSIEFMKSAKIKNLKIYISIFCLDMENKIIILYNSSTKFI